MTVNEAMNTIERHSGDPFDARTAAALRDAITEHRRRLLPHRATLSCASGIAECDAFLKLLPKH